MVMHFLTTQALPFFPMFITQLRQRYVFYFSLLFMVMLFVSTVSAANSKGCNDLFQTNTDFGLFDSRFYTITDSRRFAILDSKNSKNIAESSLPTTSIKEPKSAAKDTQYFKESNTTPNVQTESALNALDSKQAKKSEQSLDSPLSNMRTPLDLAINKRNKHLVMVSYENDSNFDSKIDKYYTAGIALFYVSKELESNQFGAKFLQFFSLQRLFHPQSIYSSFGISLSQELYTPKDRFSPIPPPTDHPYSGFSYIGLSAMNRSNNFFEMLTLDVGFVGKATLAQQIQDIIHDITGNARLAGWDTQLRNEFVANLNFNLSYSVPYIYEKSKHFFDLMPQTSLALGNARVHLQVSLATKFGYNLAQNTLPVTINSGFVRAPSHQYGFSIYGFFGAGARFVGRNMFLQGNIFAPHYAIPTSIEIQHIIGEFSWGVGLEYKRFLLTYSVTHRTREFTTQDMISHYGAITIGVSI